MAHIFYGNRDMIDEGVLEVVKTLSDDYWVLTEFDLNQRNVDWLVLRPVPDDRPTGIFSTVILTELKHTSAILDGGDYGRWREERNGVSEELIPSNYRDENPWRQLINTVNAVRAWLYINQRRFLDDAQQTLQEDIFKVWPNLLIVSEPPSLRHRLPLQPTNNYGAYHADLDSWMYGIRGWNARVGLQLTAKELGALVAAIGLQPLVYERTQDDTVASAPVPVAAPEPSDEETPEVVPPPVVVSGSDLGWLPAFTAWATGIEERVARLEAQLTQQSPQFRPTIIRPEVVDRPLTDEEKGCIKAALSTLSYMHRTPTFASLFAEMHRLIGGDSFKERNFNGFGNAKNMIDRAVKEGLVQYGPLDPNGMHTVYLATVRLQG